MKTLLIAATLLVATVAPAGAATPVPAAAVAETTISPQEVSRVMTQRGLPVQMDKASSGNPRIISTINGVKFALYFYDCNADTKCRSFQFYASFEINPKMTMERINEWNKTKRFGRAYLDQDRDPVLEYDVDLDGGWTSSTIDNAFDTWPVLLTAFQQFIRPNGK